MIRYECCRTPCHRELPCIHEACPYYRVEVYYCDRCREPAAYEFEGMHYCGDCFEDVLVNQFIGLSVPDKIEALMLEDEVRSV